MMVRKDLFTANEHWIALTCLVRQEKLNFYGSVQNSQPLGKILSRFPVHTMITYLFKTNFNNKSYFPSLYLCTTRDFFPYYLIQVLYALLPNLRMLHVLSITSYFI
jgi:hypothetical protein